jgi:hypothetical protein
MLTGEGGKGWGRSQILQRRESMILYKPFKTLWYASTGIFATLNPIRDLAQLCVGESFVK